MNPNRRINNTMEQSDKNQNIPLPGSGGKNILSFEVEDIFHVESPEYELPDRKSRIIPILIHLLDLLDEQKTKSTFFVLGWVAQRFPEIVALIDARGHEVASHGFSHSDPDKMNRNLLTEGLRRSRSILEEILQKPVHGYKTAGRLRGKHGSDIHIHAANAGYRYIFGPPVLTSTSPRSCAETVRLHDGNLIVAFTHSVLKKWGCSIAFTERLRAYPGWFVLRAIASLNKRGIPAIINLKLWELDHFQERPPGSEYANYSQYGNLGLVEEKLSRLLETFEFGSFGENLALLRQKEPGTLNQSYD